MFAVVHFILDNDQQACTDITAYQLTVFFIIYITQQETLFEYINEMREQQLFLSLFFPFQL